VEPTSAEQEWIDAAVNAYRRHIEPTGDELGRLEAVMYIRTLYLACFATGAPSQRPGIPRVGLHRTTGYFSSTAAATRAAFRR